MGDGGWGPRIAGATLALAGVGVASAHEIGETRFDAPVPVGAVLVGAAATVALTAWWLARRPTSSDPRVARLGTVPSSAVAAARSVARGGFLLAFALALFVGVAGSQAPADSVVTVFVWSVWLKGVGLVAALVGSPWRVLSPWHTVYAVLRYLEGDRLALAGGYPASLGRWPALLAVLALGAVENLTLVPRSPRATAVVVAGYAAVMVAGAVVFGPTFLDRADGLAVLYRLFGRVAPLRIDDGGVTVAAPWRGCTDAVADLPLAGVVVAAVFVVSFDGFASTPLYQSLLFAVRGGTGAGSWTGVTLYVAGFGLFCVALAGAATLTAGILGDTATVTGTLRALAPTVVPIAVAYEIAHNYPLVARGLGRGVAVLAGEAGDPLGWLSLSAFWASQVVLVVAGHLVAVVAADRAIGRRSPAAVARVPLTALMIGYTALSLWIVSRPVA